MPLLLLKEIKLVELNFTYDEPSWLEYKKLVAKGQTTTISLLLNVVLF